MEVEKQTGTGPDQKMIGNIPYTPRVKKVLALASKEAKNLNHTYVGTEHILLGLLREGDGIAAKVLRNLDVDIEQCRQEILKELDPNFAAEESSIPQSGEKTDWRRKKGRSQNARAQGVWPRPHGNRAQRRHGSGHRAQK
jgi:ATP-dependent Clp protease ATP-binding subunit ClpC